MSTLTDAYVKSQKRVEKLSQRKLKNVRETETFTTYEAFNAPRRVQEGLDPGIQNNWIGSTTSWVTTGIPSDPYTFANGKTSQGTTPTSGENIVDFTPDKNSLTYKDPATYMTALIGTPEKSIFDKIQKYDKARSQAALAAASSDKKVTPDAPAMADTRNWIIVENTTYIVTAAGLAALAVGFALTSLVGASPTPATTPV
jgi:hypothetical protein